MWSRERNRRKNRVEKTLTWKINTSTYLLSLFHLPPPLTPNSDRTFHIKDKIITHRKRRTGDGNLRSQHQQRNQLAASSPWSHQRWGACNGLTGHTSSIVIQLTSFGNFPINSNLDIFLLIGIWRTPAWTNLTGDASWLEAGFRAEGRRLVTQTQEEKELYFISFK